MINVKYIQAIVNKQGTFEGLLTGMAREDSEHNRTLVRDQIVLKAKSLTFKPFGKLIKLSKYPQSQGMRKRKQKNQYQMQRTKKDIK